MVMAVNLQRPLVQLLGLSKLALFKQQTVGFGGGVIYPSTTYISLTTVGPMKIPREHLALYDVNGSIGIDSMNCYSPGRFIRGQVRPG